MSHVLPVGDPHWSHRPVDSRFAGIQSALAALDVPRHDRMFDDLLLQLSRIEIPRPTTTGATVGRPPARGRAETRPIDRGRRDTLWAAVG